MPFIKVSPDMPTHNDIPHHLLFFLCEIPPVVIKPLGQSDELGQRPQRKKTWFPSLRTPRLSVSVLKSLAASGTDRRSTPQRKEVCSRQIYKVEQKS